ncbi:hypothetical protein K1719_009927 [Acacia pycnantha]|nr:hypothetical protein K1719_009927 [Acacia pycnantha]
MKAHTPTADYGYVHHQSQQQGRKPMAVAKKGDYVLVFIAIGMIALSVGFGLHKAWHQLRTLQTVRVKKQRRETLPEPPPASVPVVRFGDDRSRNQLSERMLSSSVLLTS